MGERTEVNCRICKSFLHTTEQHKYDIIYADPPWKQLKGGLRKVRPNQERQLDYNTLNLNKIKKIISKFQGKVLFLWTIDKFLFKTQELAESLGYKLHARIVWDKENGVAPAFTIRYSHEYLLWMYKFPMLKIDSNMRGKFTTVIREKSTKHSKKPIKAYELIEALYPIQNKIELFARNRRDGWDALGDELQQEGVVGRE